MPQVELQTLGCVPAQLYAKSTVQLEHPSPLVPLPSSQASTAAFLPSPQVVMHELGCVPVQV
jgi:hypothetical protein